jgi:hypothetical protein
MGLVVVVVVVGKLGVEPLSTPAGEQPRSLPVSQISPFCQEFLGFGTI